MNSRKKIIRACTVSSSLGFVEGVLPRLKERYEVQLLSSPGEYLNYMESKYVVVTHGVDMYRRISPMKDLRSLMQIIMVFRKEKPYMVHSMTPKAGLLCMIAAWICRVPIRVHTFTGLVWPTATGITKKILMFTDWVTCACSTHIIPEGEGVKADLINNRITQKSMKVLGYGNVCGVDMIRFSRRKNVLEKVAQLRDDSYFTFVFVGRIVRDKGIGELVSAFYRLHCKYDNIRLWLVGRYEDSLDPISIETKKMIENNGAIESVGPQYDDDLLAYYAASDCFVFPSYREGFPNTVLEAGAMDLPSIVTDINGSKEIIINGENGLIVPSHDTDSLCYAMEELLTNIPLRNHMVRNARTIIASHYEQGYVQDCLLDFYKEILK